MQPTETHVLITGAGGMLGSAFSDHLSEKGYIVRALDHAALDVTDRDVVLKEQEWKPDWIIHCAGIVNVDFCEDNRAVCFENHVDGTKNVVALAKSTGAKLFYPQSFLIFDGKENPITEEAAPHPLSIYGEAKWEAEQIVRKELPDALVVRMGGFFGGCQKDKNFVGTFAHILKKNIEEKNSFVQVSNRIWQPTYTKDLAENITLLLEQEKTGIYHMASHGKASFFEVAKAMVELLTIDNNIVVTEIPAHEYKEIAERPFCVLLENRRLRDEGLDRMRPWEEALRDYLSNTYFKKLFR
ncbi:MAG: dTDP-4-dehydrorhamnose reductase [Parcubacteria group bacterium Gr01-1014_29]|nr:MAG: dTDP-4-dehydrorhamnose reductase [Parcubacteria group bacterium Gr01-1014_29]